MAEVFFLRALANTPSDPVSQISLANAGSGIHALRSPSVAALDDEISDSAARICTVEGGIRALMYTLVALDAARKPLLFRRRRKARRAAVVAQTDELAAQLAALWVVLSAIRARRNARTSFLCRMPLELVVRILEHVAPFEPPYDRLVEWPDKYAGWEPAMLVCTHLRSAALSSPALWARITDGNRNARHIFCTKRAGAAPYSISFQTSLPRLIIWNLEDCTRPVHDARLFLWSYDVDMHELIAWWMPHLRSLVYWIRIDSSRSWDLVSHTWLRGVSLTELVLHGVELLTDGLELPNLVRFELQNVRVKDGLPNLLRLVRAAAGLDFLCLGLAHVAEIGSSTSVDPISLPFLARSYVDGSAEDVLILIHALPAPTDTYHITSRIATDEEARATLIAEVSSWRDGAPPVPCIGHEAKSSASDAFIDWETEAQRVHPASLFLKLTHPRTPDAPTVHYTGMFDSTPLLLAALHDARSLRLSAHCEAILVDAAADPLGPLGAVEDLALPGAWVPAAQDALWEWLCARATAGQPVGTVDFLGAISLVYVEDLRALRVLAKEVLEKGWVDEVLHDGWTVSRETYMPADV